MSPLLKSVPVMSKHGFYRLAYTEWKPSEAMRTVMCVHGVSRNSRDFDFLAQRLAAQGIRVIAPDLPGRGRSDWLPSGLQYNVAEYAHALAVLIARLDLDDLDWVGTSLGGYVGMVMAATAGTPIRRLVLNDIGARIAAVALNRIGSYLKKRWSFSSAEEIEAHLREIYAAFGPLDDRQWRHLAQHSTVRSGDGSYRFHYDPKIGDAFSYPLWIDHTLWGTWDRIACPVLVMRGAQSDLLSSSTMREMARRGMAGRRDAVRIVEVPDAGHAPSLLADQQIDLVVNFLNKREAVAEPA